MPAARTRTAPRTFRAAAAAGAPDLTALSGVHRAETDPPHEREAERYDTADGRLAAAGMTLTVLRDDAPERWELELPDAAGAERIRVAGTPGGDLPAELDELVRGVRRDRMLRPVGRIRTYRAVTRLLDAGGGLLAAVAHDHVTVSTLGRATEVDAWTEARLEPEDAGPGLIGAIEERLGEAGFTPGGPRGARRLDRMLGATRGPRRRAGRKGSAGAVLMEYVAAQADRIAAEELRVRRNQPDAVHQLRVAARRLRSALKAYRKLLDRDAVADGLRRLGRALAPARDAEVLRERIAGGLADLPPELRLGPVQAQVQRHFGRVEAEARAAALSELDGPEHEALRCGLDDLVERPPLAARAKRRAPKELPRLARRSAKRLERAVAAAIEAGGDDAKAGEEEALHSARKAGKRLRYATEVARPAVGKPAKRFAKNLKAVQKALGDHQDAVVARNALRELGAAAHSAGENGFSFGVLLGRDDAHAARVAAALPDLWDSAWRRKHRAWLR